MPTLLPLTQAQLGIWFAHTLGDNKALYSIGETIEFLGPIDVALFEKALRQVVAETDALHLRFVETNEGPRQFILPELAWTLTHVDLAAAHDPRAAAQAWISDEIGHAVDPTSEPLFRYVLLRIAQDQYIWYARYHHLCTDGLGTSLIVRRTAARYSASLAGAAAAGSDQQLLLERPGSFARFLDAEGEYFQSADYAADREYWAAQLAARPDRATLAGGAPSWSGGFLRRTLTVPADACDHLRALAAGCGTGIGQLLLAASAAYVHRIAGVSEVILGMTAMVRPRGPMQRIVATTADIVPLRLSLEPGGHFESLLRQTARRVLESMRHGRYRSEFIRRDLGLRPSDPEIYGPVVNVFSFDYDVRFGDCRVRVQNVANWRLDDFAIGVHDRRSGRGIDIDLCANPRLYDAEALAVHGERFLALLEGLAAAVTPAAVQVGGIDLFLPGERERILREFNQTSSPTGSLLPFHSSFEGIAARQAQSTAVVYENRSLSYRELNRQANQLAYLLRARGVTRTDRIGLCIGRSPELVVAMLATLKVGAAYIPLDPRYPRDRLEHMVRESAPRYVLTCSAFVDRLSRVTHPILLDGEAERAELSAQPADDLQADVGSGDLAYIMYTSGSTGQPKGVMIEHGGLSNYIGWAMEHYPEVKSGVSVMSTPFAFDASITSLHVPLAAGGTVVIAPEERELESLEGLFRGGATLGLLKMTPAVLAALGERLSALDIECRVGLFVVGGEPLPASTVALWRRIAPGCRMVNEYGPTETVVGCTIFDASSVPLRGDSVPIGWPIWNTRIHLLDAALQPVPVGAVGEIHIGGFGVARGYLNRPQLTAERFLRDPFDPEGSSRLYKTGDLARYLPDGNIEFLGRNDAQVKVRGFRIETGEIETALKRHDLVKDALVIVQGKSEQARLIVYALVDQAATPLSGGGARIAGAGVASTLKSHLRRLLPDFMVPATVIGLPAWPLTSNGKVDRRALVALEPLLQAEGSMTADKQAPASAAEHRLARIWSDALGVSDIGIDDNFFDLGGNSLLAVRVFTDILHEFGASLSLSTLLDAPTVRQLASVIGGGSSEGGSASLRTIRALGSRPPLFLVPGVGGNVLCYYELARLLGSQQPVYALQSRGLDGAEKPLTRVQDIAKRFVHEILAVAPDGPIYLGGACVGGVIAFEMAQQLIAAGRPVPLLCMFDTWHPSVHRRCLVPIYAPPALSSLAFAAQRLRANLRMLRPSNPSRLAVQLRRHLRSMRQIVEHHNVYGGDTMAQYADRVSRANQWANSIYFPRRYPGRITLFIAAERPTGKRRDRRLEWHELAQAECRVHYIAAGDSGQMLERPHVLELSRLLTEELELTRSEGESEMLRVRGSRAAPAIPRQARSG